MIILQGREYAFVSYSPGFTDIGQAVTNAGGHETTPEYQAWVESRRHPPPEEVMEQRKKKPAGSSRQAELGVSR